MRLRNELCLVEQGIIDLESGISLLRAVILSIANEDQTMGQIQEALYGLENYFQSNGEQLRDAFEMAWNEDLRCELIELMN